MKSSLPLAVSNNKTINLWYAQKAVGGGKHADASRFLVETGILLL
ncbi:hypothetical protein QWZ15_18905 [Cyclobacterium jeungdonense]|uniref:Uncharacterized protein n=1 Tax=Cyclobacterium jeungdonense TaxID=708087 RepID=A0ABT8CBK6_9BACT|nr:hypothetical protein [Cyclobacterium jeungdonense]MDN3689900.1 hypothetical protein [Cyclobacterium jeungdonense]